MNQNQENLIHHRHLPHSGMYPPSDSGSPFQTKDFEPSRLQENPVTPIIHLQQFNSLLYLESHHQRMLLCKSKDCVILAQNRKPQF